MSREFVCLIRSNFLIKSKKILNKQRSAKVTGHAQEVLDTVKSLKN